MRHGNDSPLIRSGVLAAVTVYLGALLALGPFAPEVSRAAAPAAHATRSFSLNEVVSHDPMAAHFADRVFALRHGRLSDYDPNLGAQGLDCAGAHKEAPL